MRRTKIRISSLPHVVTISLLKQEAQLILKFKGIILISKISIFFPVYRIGKWYQVMMLLTVIIVVFGE